MNHVIYFATQERKGHERFPANQPEFQMYVKIGYTTEDRIQKRMAVSRSGNPKKITIYGIVRVANHKTAESYCKGFLHDKRIPKKEWFKLTKRECDSCIWSLEIEQTEELFKHLDTSIEE